MRIRVGIGIGVILAVAACGESSSTKMRTPGPPPVSADIHEVNNTQGACSTIVLDFSDPGMSLHNAGDEDYFCFALALESDVTALVSFSGSGDEVEMELLDTGGFVVATGQADPAGRILVASVSCGSFALRVWSPIGATLVYGLDVGAVATQTPLVPDAQEPNDDPGSAATLTDPRFAPVSVGGLTLHDGLNEDWFTFPLGASANIEVGLIALGSTNSIDMELLDAGLTVLARGSLISQVLGPGDYFIRVFPLNCRTSSYSLTVEEI